MKKDGYTKGCYGCRAIREKWSSIQAHNHTCRTRISEKMMADEIGRRRVEEADERIKKAKLDREAGKMGSKSSGEGSQATAMQEDEDSNNTDHASRGGEAKRKRTEETHPDDIGENDDIGANVDPKKWEAFVEKHGLKRSAESEEVSSESRVQRARTERNGTGISRAEAQKKRSTEGDGDEEARAKSKRINLMEKQLDKHLKELLSIDVAEIFSPERVAQFAKQYELKPGWSFDLTTCDETGKPWDFNDASMRNKAARRVLKDKPTLLIGSLPCTYFSQLMHINWPCMDPTVAMETWNEAIKHLKFCVHVHKF